jgi:hypothetical protein
VVVEGRHEDAAIVLRHLARPYGDDLRCRHLTDDLDRLLATRGSLRLRRHRREGHARDDYQRKMLH